MKGRTAQALHKTTKALEAAAALATALAAMAVLAVTWVLLSRLPWWASTVIAAYLVVFLVRCGIEIPTWWHGGWKLHRRVHNWIEDRTEPAARGRDHDSDGHKRQPRTEAVRRWLGDLWDAASRWHGQRDREAVEAERSEAEVIPIGDRNDPKRPKQNRLNGTGPDGSQPGIRYDGLSRDNGHAADTLGTAGPSNGDRSRSGRFQPTDPAERFWSKVTKHAAEGCWEWTGTFNEDGYGHFSLTDQPGSSRAVKAHRWAYEQANGPIPEAMTLDHSCHNKAAARGQCAGGKTCPHRACVRPDHLEAVTHVENVRRAAAWRNRQIKKENRR